VAGHADQAKAFLAAAPPRQGGEHHIRQRDLLLAELEHLARACTKDDPEAYYCEVHPDHVERAERVVKRVRADMSKTELP
jgi:tagatose-1,6-bisphosphate aldolase